MEIKNTKVLSEFISDGEVADEVNKVFPIDTEENTLKSLAFLLSKDAHKVYNTQEQMSMLNIILDKAKQFNNEFLDKIQKLVKGGSKVGNVFTKEEMNTEAAKIANATVAKKEDEDKMASMSSEVDKLKLQIEKLTEATKTQTKEAQRVTDEKVALETQLADIKTESEKMVLANARLEKLKFDLGDSKDYVIAYLKNVSDEDFANFKQLLEIVASSNEEKANEKKTDAEKAEDKKKAEASKKKLADHSEEVPNNSEEPDKFAAFNKALSLSKGVK